MWTAPGVLPLQAHPVAPCGNQSPGWGLLYSFEGGGHRLAFPHSKAGPWQSGRPLAGGGPLAVIGETISNPLSSHPFQEVLVSAHMRAGSAGRLSQIPLPLLQHALRLAAFGQLHKVLGMDPLPSKMPKKPKNENPVDYTVQIPPSTTYAITPMKRPMEEDGEEKSPSKKKKKIQKKEEKA